MAPSHSQNRYRLANQILDLIRSGGFEAGHRLREQTLGDLLQVSRTPVRAALALLAEHGIAASRPNQGYVLVQMPSGLTRLAFDGPAPADQDLYGTLIKDRLAGKVPVSLTQTEIARRYGVDRPVLVRTLSRMAEDGLVARNKGRGWTFLPTLDTRTALRSSYDFRLTLEPSGFLLESFKADPGALERCRMQHLYLVDHPDIGSVDLRQLFELDAAFHEMCAEFSGNVFLAQAIQQQNRLRRLLEFNGYANRRRVRDWCREHLGILEAIDAGRLEQAGDRMRLHLVQAFEAAPAVTSSADKAQRAAALIPPGAEPLA